MKETKDLIIGDVFNNFFGKKLIGVILLTIIVITIVVADTIPFWAVLLGICGPAFALWKLKIWKEFDNCKFLEED